MREKGRGEGGPLGSARDYFHLLNLQLRLLGKRSAGIGEGPPTLPPLEVELNALQITLAASVHDSAA